MSNPSTVPISLLEDTWQIALHPPAGSRNLRSDLAAKICTTPRHVCSRKTIRREVLCEREEARALLQVFQSAATSFAISKNRRGTEIAATGATLVIAAMRAWQPGHSGNAGGTTQSIA